MILTKYQISNSSCVNNIFFPCIYLSLFSLPCFIVLFGFGFQDYTFIFAEDLDGGEYLFAFRMLMVLFRREFSFVDSLYLWEVKSNYLINLGENLVWVSWCETETLYYVVLKNICRNHCLIDELCKSYYNFHSLTFNLCILTFQIYKLIWKTMNEEHLYTYYMVLVLKFIWCMVDIFKFV